MTNARRFLCLVCALSAGVAACSGLKEDSPSPIGPDAAADSTVGMPDGGAVQDGAAFQDGSAARDAFAAIDAPSASGNKRVFVTSATFPPRFSLVDDNSITLILGRADALCTQAAINAKVGGTYRAWLGGVFGNTAVTASAHALAISPPYENLVGNIVFQGIPTSGVAALSPPAMTEFGITLPLADDKLAWTGDNLDLTCTRSIAGTLLSWGGDTGTNASTGNPRTTATWYGASSIRCGTEAHLYCFEQ